MSDRYTIEEFTREISVEEYLARFHRPEEVWGYCHACSNYGKQWGCPPFDFDIVGQLTKYDSLLLTATKISLIDRKLSSCEVEDILLHERIRLEERLLGLERTLDGLACTFIGRCLHCGAEQCSRLSGTPCRHPELVRPSLEAYGFDVAKTLSELFAINLQWSSNGSLPDYLTLTCGVFYKA
jgi:predicted metal-binding protein